jgi:myo-inositol-1(or 4)-monophosphatase
VDVALRAARAGAAVLLETGLPHPGIAAELKGRGDYVTATDRRSESAILEVLAREAPGISVIAEEGGGVRASTMWAVDPLDGTTNFTRGFPSVGISVALLDGGEPVVGVVLAPFLEIEFTASKGQGAFMNGERLPQHRALDPSDAVVATGFPFRDKALLPRYVPMLRKALERFEDLRRAGAAALDLAWTAAGTFDGFFELGLHAWDVAAGAALVREVGGRVTDWAGGDSWIETGDILAAAPAVHEVLLELAAQPLDR